MRNTLKKDDIVRLLILLADELNIPTTSEILKLQDLTEKATTLDALKIALDSLEKNVNLLFLERPP